MTDALQQFRDALTRRGIIPPRHLIRDGYIHRCDAEGHHGYRDAAYLLHLDGGSGGGFRHWCDGPEWETWTPSIGRKPSPVEVAVQHERIEASKRSAQVAAEKPRSLTALWQWVGCVARIERAQ